MYSEDETENVSMEEDPLLTDPLEIHDDDDPVKLEPKEETCDEELPEYNDDDGSDYDDHEDRDEDVEKDEKFAVNIKRLKWICPKEPKRPSRERKAVFIKRECDDDEELSKTKQKPARLYKKKEGVKAKPHKCPDCHKAFAHPRELRGHIIRIHEPSVEKELIPCDICNKMVQRQGLKHHKERTHTDKYLLEQELIPCDICDKLVQRKGLEKHKERLHSSKEYSCEFCDFKSSVRMVVVRHTDKKHEKVSVTCPVCNREVFNLNEHLKRHKTMKYRCTNCDFQAGIKAEVEEHFGLEHLRDGEEIPKDFAQLVNPKPWHFKLVQCQFCSYSSNNVSNVRKHTRTVHNDEKEQCDICFEWFKAVNTHKRLVHERVRNFACNFCDYRTVNNSQLANHIRAKHTDIDVRLPCPTCGKKVKDLNQHMKSMHSDNPTIKAPKFFCEYCPYKSRDKSALTAHVKAKHLHQTTDCEICGKAVIKGTMSMHMKCHKENRFSCVPCGRTYRERRDLGKHILYHHRHHRTKCEVCKSNDVTDYKAHIKFNHKDVDWKNMDVPNSDREILSIIVRWLDELFAYFGDKDSLEEKLVPVFERLKSKGKLDQGDVEELSPSPHSGGVGAVNLENTGECSNNDNETVEARENYAGEINDSSIISEDINVDANENFHEDVENVSAVTSEDFELCENIVDGGIDAAVAVENDGMDVTKEESVDDDGDNWIGVSITDVRSGTGDPTQLKENLGVKLEPWGEEIHIKEEQIDESEGEN